MTIYKITNERKEVGQALSDFQKGHPLGLLGRDLQKRLKLVENFRNALQQTGGSRSKTLACLESDVAEYEQCVRHLASRYAYPDHKQSALSRFDRVNSRKREEDSLSVGCLRNQIHSIERRLGIAHSAYVRTASASSHTSSHSPVQSTLPSELPSSNSSISSASLKDKKVASLWQRFLHWLLKDAKVVLPVYKEEAYSAPTQRLPSVQPAPLKNPREQWLKKHNISRGQLYSLLTEKDYNAVGAGVLNSFYNDFLHGDKIILPEIVQYFDARDQFMKALLEFRAAPGQIEEDIQTHQALKAKNKGLLKQEIEAVISLLQSRLRLCNSYLTAEFRLHLAGISSS